MRIRGTAAALTITALAAVGCTSQSPTTSSGTTQLTLYTSVTQTP